MAGDPATATAASVDDWEHNQLRKLRRYLLLLASLAATVTYAAGLDPPGGSYVETEGEHKAGNSILRATNHRRYLAFYYSNATAFAASLVVILLLLVLPDKINRRPDTIPLPFLRGRWRNLDLQTTHLHVLQFVMVLDLLALLVAYTAGSCRDKVATFYTAALVLALCAYVGYHILEALRDSFGRRASRRSRKAESPRSELEQQRKVLMLLSIFAATITYDAGLNPPGGFWERTTGGGLHEAGEVILKHKHGGRFAVFLFGNTAAFIVSLFTVVLLLDKKLTANATTRLLALYGFVVVTLVTLVAAYAAGSCRKTSTTTYTAALAAPVLLSIFLAAAAHYIREWVSSCMACAQGARTPSPAPPPQPQHQGDGQPVDPLKEKRSLVLLLGTLAASITYQAGLNPPGGVWLENQSGHQAGDPILSYTDHKRYITFFYCNSIALVASIVVILILQIKALLKRRALHVHVAVVFDLFGLVGAYIAGSSRTLRASVHLIVLAAAFLAYVAGIFFHVMRTSTPDPRSNLDAAETTILKKRRKRLLLFAILIAAISYQAGLSPPGGFWREDRNTQQRRVGSPILEDMYPRRYKAFFYCNAMSFMASIALIILLQVDRTYQLRKGIRFYGLYACMLVGMLVLMAAYAAGSARKVKTSIYVFVLVTGVSAFIAVLFALFLRDDDEAALPTTTLEAAGAHLQSSDDNGSSSIAQNNNDDDDPQRSHSTASSSNANGGETNHHPRRQGDEDHTTKRKYVMLLAMLAASVTYEAGLDPPGGVWPEGYAAGSPVLHDSNLRRYHVFFYSNSSSFVASIVIIILLLQSELRNMLAKKQEPMPNMPGQQQQQGGDEKEPPNVPAAQQQRGGDEPHDDDPLLLLATNTVVALDLVGLLVAYAAGSSRTMEMSLYVVALVVVVVIYIVAFRLPMPCVNSRPGEGTRSNTQGGSGERGNGGNGQNA